jgi:hypothetical protein
MEIKTFRISNKRELTFLGDQIGFATDEDNPQEPGEWHKLDLWIKYDKETKQFDRYVLGTAKLTSWGLDGERDELGVKTFTTIKEALRFVERKYSHLSEVLARDIDARGVAAVPK